MNNDQFCIVTRHVIENDFKINHFQHRKIQIGDQPSSWLFMHGDEEDGFMNEASNFQFVKLSEVILNQPLLREYLTARVGSQFGYCPTHERIEDWTEKRTLTFERKIFAPNAANVGFELLAYLSYFPGDVGPVIIAACFAIPAVLHHPAWILLSVIFLTRAFVNLARIYEHFRLGSLLPGVVVRTRPLLLAVEFQPSNLESPKRYIKLVKIKMKSADRKKVKIGDRFATATLFATATWYSKSFEMSPLPINYATGSPHKTKSAMNRFKDSQWKTLNEAISQIDAPYKAGLYEVQPIGETDSVT